MHCVYAFFSRSPEEAADMMERFSDEPNDPKYLQFFPVDVPMEQLRAEYEYGCTHSYYDTSLKQCGGNVEETDAFMAEVKNVFGMSDEEFEKYISEPAYDDFEQFLLDRFDYDCVYDAENDRAGHWVNPDAMFDYCTLGGRWENALIKKDGTACSEAWVRDVDFAASATFYGYVMPDGARVSEFSTPEEDVQRQFAEVIKDESLYITVVDCHV